MFSWPQSTSLQMNRLIQCAERLHVNDVCLFFSMVQNVGLFVMGPPTVAQHAVKCIFRLHCVYVLVCDNIHSHPGTIRRPLPRPGNVQSVVCCLWLLRCSLSMKTTRQELPWSSWCPEMWLMATLTTRRSASSSGGGVGVRACVRAREL